MIANKPWTDGVRRGINVVDNQCEASVAYHWDKVAHKWSTEPIRCQGRAKYVVEGVKVCGKHRLAVLTQLEKEDFLKDLILKEVAPLPGERISPFSDEWLRKLAKKLAPLLGSNWRTKK